MAFHISLPALLPRLKLCLIASAVLLDKSFTVMVLLGAEQLKQSPVSFFPYNELLRIAVPVFPIHAGDILLFRALPQLVT